MSSSSTNLKASLAIKNFAYSGVWNPEENESPPKVWKPTTPEFDLSLWVLDEPFEFGILPMQPSHKISIPLLRKVSAYIKTRNMYPVLNLSSWLHISQLKLQLGTQIPWIYLRMFDILRQQKNQQDKTIGYWDFCCEQFRNGKKDKGDEFRVPTYEFLIFLYIQNSYKTMKKICVQMTNAVKKRDDRWPLKSIEPKIQSEQLRYQYLYDNIEDLIDFLQEGYKSTDEIPITMIEALNLILCCTSNPRECKMDSLQTVIEMPSIAQIVDYDYNTQTVSRSKFIKWIRTLLRLNPWGPASSFLHAPKIFPPSGSTKKEDNDCVFQNRIILNHKDPPYSWAVISNICHQVFYYDEAHEYSNLKLHRCNHSYIYIPTLNNCVLIDKCNNSTIFLGVTVKIVRFFCCKNIKVYCASRLVIITDCTASTFYLLTPCRPIVTGAKNESVQIGPYNTFYPMLEDHLVRASLKPNVTNWNEPIQIGSDGMTAIMDSLAVSLVKPSEFCNFSFPFELPGKTIENPLLLPDEYQKAVEAKTRRFDEWKERISKDKLNPEQTTAYHAAILKSFNAWLTETGYGAELDGLKNLQLKLECQNDLGFPSLFEFSGDDNNNNHDPTLPAIHDDADLAELFDDITMAEPDDHL